MYIKHIKHKLSHHKWIFFSIFLVLIIGVATCFILCILHKETDEANISINNVTTISTYKISSLTPEFSKTLFSTTDPTSPWIVVNKSHPFNDLTYVPNNLVLIDGVYVSELLENDLNALLSDAEAANAEPSLVSGYRSYHTQLYLYNYYVSIYGQSESDTFSARAGYSEHQTGFAIDFGSSTSQCNFENCFATTTEGAWLTENAYKYGFILRYPEDKTTITGYKYESWHFRYVGKELSNYLHDNNIGTLEEFFDISGGGYL